MPLRSLPAPTRVIRRRWSLDGSLSVFLEQRVAFFSIWPGDRQSSLTWIHNMQPNERRWEHLKSEIPWRPKRRLGDGDGIIHSFACSAPALKTHFSLNHFSSSDILRLYYRRFDLASSRSSRGYHVTHYSTNSEKTYTSIELSVDLSRWGLVFGVRHV